jgi:ABC-type amino acid transport substrate-binding protein
MSEEATAGWLDDLMDAIDSGRVDAALGAGPLGDIVARECDNRNGVITRETLQCLVGDTWLNDRVIIRCDISLWSTYTYQANKRRLSFNSQRHCL